MWSHRPSCSNSVRDLCHPFLLPVKLMFFCQFGDIACLMPFLSVFFKDIGLNAAETGVIFGALPFLALLCKPSIGYIADRFRQTYRLLQISLIIFVIFLTSVCFVPPMHGLLSESTNCTSQSMNGTNQPCTDMFGENLTIVLATTPKSAYSWVQTDKVVVRSTMQFWLIGALMVIAWFAFGAVWILDDFVTMKLVSQSPVLSSYGENRAFGTTGYAVFALAIGLIVDRFSTPTHRNFVPAFVGYGVTAAVSILITFLLPPLIHKKDESAPHAAWRSLLSPDVLLFCSGALVVGLDSGFLHAYLGWYQAELGASSFLLGFTIFVECCYETPMMAISGWVIRKLGYHVCMLLCITSFGIRFMCYSAIDNPWLVLPIDVLHALGFGLFHVNMTSFAYAKSLGGNGATLQGILCAIFEGFGQGIGGLVAGFLYQRFGGKQTWMGYGVFSFGAAVLYGTGIVLLWIAAQRKLRTLSVKMS